MVNVEIVIKRIGEGKPSERLNLTLSELESLKSNLATIGSSVSKPVWKSASVDLSKVEQGALVAELLKRTGVSQAIVNKDQRVVMGGCIEGPASIIIIQGGGK